MLLQTSGDKHRSTLERCEFSKLNMIDRAKLCSQSPRRRRNVRKVIQRFLRRSNHQSHSERLSWRNGFLQLSHRRWLEAARHQEIACRRGKRYDVPFGNRLNAKCTMSRGRPTFSNLVSWSFELENSSRRGTQALSTELILRVV